MTFDGEPCSASAFTTVNADQVFAARKATDRPLSTNDVREAGDAEVVATHTLIVREHTR